MIGQAIEFEKVNGVLLPKNGTVSNYQPSQGVAELTRQIKIDYQTGLSVLNKPFLEFDNLSPLEEMNTNQKAFLIHSDIEFTREDEKWRWPGVRPTVRNKILSIAAHLTAQILVPNIFAQNPEDMEDKQMAEVMRLILEWNIRNSDYDITFLNGIVAGLVNPVAYLSVDFLETMQTIKKKTRKGFKTKEVVDEFMSGLQVSNVPLDEVFITNPYEYHLQRQRAIGRRRFAEYSELKKIFGRHENWQYVAPGIRTVFNEEDSTFYDQKDENLITLAEYFVYQNREEDLGVPYVNGIYFGDDQEDPVNGNPIKHRDQAGRPKYNLVKFGAEPIDEKKFYFYKSIASKMMQDYNLTNKIWRIVVDTGTLNLKPPLGIMGSAKLESDIYYPGSVVGNLGKDTRVMQFPSGETREGWNILQALENSISESTQDPFRQGLAKDLPDTAFQQAQLTQNARIQLGLIGKMIIQAVRDLGTLMVEDIIHHQTVGEVEELLSGQEKIRFRRFILPNQTEEGRTLSKEIRFDGDLIEAEMSREDMESREFELLEEEGGIDGDRRIMLVNPRLFRKMRFLVFIDADALLPVNEAFEQALKLDAYSKAVLNPLIAGDFESMRAVTRDLLLGALRATKGKEEKYLPKGRPQIASLPVGGGSESRLPLSEQVRKSQEAGALSELQKVG